MANKVKYDWDGETIVQKVKIDDQKLTPREMLNSIDEARGQINQMEGQIQKLENNLKQTKQDLESAKAFVKDREEFEEKCVELQTEKLKDIIKKIDAECQEKARIEAQRQIDADPNAMSESQQKNLSYVLYQRYLATNEKIAHKIAKRIITQCLFEKPIFTNPFA